MEMYFILKKDFTFISNDRMEKTRKEQGWKLTDKYPFELETLEDEDALNRALELSRESDVIIIGSAPEIYVKERMKNKSPGLTFRYSERIFKKGKWRFLSPRGLLGRAKTYYRYGNKKIYMLCASAYTSADLMLQGAYLGKCYKWGYFPETISYALKELMLKKKQTKINILWCGRFLKWKHPEAALWLASRLKEDGFEFNLKIIGAGELEDKIKIIITRDKLEPYVKLLGTRSPKEVRGEMEKANIFLCTSDFNEGWGAVINEAMNSGCALVASHAVGAVPYLIQDGENGLIYKNADMNSLYKKTRLLFQEIGLCEKLGSCAYDTITREWNAKEATRRFFLLTNDLIEKGYSNRFRTGPCSKAEIIGNYWYKD